MAVFCGANHLLPLSLFGSLQSRLFTPVNNNRLVVFRVLFGFIMAVECLGSVITGRVKETFVDTPFNFPFIGFEWLTPLHGPWMNYYYLAMSVLCLFVAAGFYYRMSAVLLALLWTMSYLAEKTHYNNHYYLMVLLAWIMAMLPADKRLSVDARAGRTAVANTCYQWQHWLLIGQIGIVYTFAAIAKMNPDWLRAMPLKLWMFNFRQLPVVGPVFQSDLAPWIMAYFGLLFDLLIVPLLLWKKTRKGAFFVSVFFHLSNSLLFGIGTFPYLAIALCVFFASPDWLERRVLRQSTFVPDRLAIVPAGRAALLLGGATVYLLVQMLLPVRHWLIEGNVNWTEEGHRMAWRMMLRSKSGGIMFRVKDKQTGQEFLDFPNQILPEEQFRDLASHPDLIWQYAQYLRRHYAKKGLQPAVFAEGCCSLNGKPCLPMVDPKTDLAAVRWNAWGHNEWVLLQHE